MDTRKVKRVRRSTILKCESPTPFIMLLSMKIYFPMLRAKGVQGNNNHKEGCFMMFLVLKRRKIAPMRGRATTMKTNRQYKLWKSQL